MMTKPTGHENAKASNVKAAFARLLGDTKLAQKLRKNMGLGDTTEPLGVEFGGTGAAVGATALRNLARVDELKSAALTLNSERKSFLYSTPGSSSGSGSTRKNYSHAKDENSEAQIYVGTYTGTNLSIGSSFNIAVGGSLANGSQFNATLSKNTKIRGGFTPMISNTRFNDDGSISSTVMFFDASADNVTEFQSISFSVTKNGAVSADDAKLGAAVFVGGVLFTGQSCEIKDSRGVSSHWYLTNDGYNSASRVSVTENGAVSAVSPISITKNDKKTSSSNAPFVLQYRNSVIATCVAGTFICADITKSDSFVDNDELVSIGGLYGNSPMYSFSEYDGCYFLMLSSGYFISLTESGISSRQINADTIFSSQKKAAITNNTVPFRLGDGNVAFMTSPSGNSSYVVIGDTGYFTPFSSTEFRNINYSTDHVNFTKFFGNKYLLKAADEEYGRSGIEERILYDA